MVYCEADRLTRAPNEPIKPSFRGVFISSSNQILDVFADPTGADKSRSNRAEEVARGSNQPNIFRADQTEPRMVSSSNQILEVITDPTGADKSRSNRAEEVARGSNQPNIFRADQTELRG
ncbi:hypothetical protein JCGZ_12214 [Jatropha curcas]|uniref:Uncharacterized protein n=1 Tax=Jatropha curcas TaxID=180498 RepID=A0A067KQL5_JATCU|nr:hypothetical protein JCGZ_12214 [Jatropha curcas]